MRIDEIVHAKSFAQSLAWSTFTINGNGLAALLLPLDTVSMALYYFLVYSRCPGNAIKKIEYGPCPFRVSWGGKTNLCGRNKASFHGEIVIMVNQSGEGQKSNYSLLLTHCRWEELRKESHPIPISTL